MKCTLDIYTDYLIISTGATTATGLTKLYEGAISHDQITRLLTNNYLNFKGLWLKVKPLIRSAEQTKNTDEFAVLIVDDSILEKPYTDQNAFIATYFDHSQHCYVNGLKLVGLLYQIGNLSVPIAATLMEKTLTEWDAKAAKHKTKNEVDQERVPAENALSNPATSRL